MTKYYIASDDGKKISKYSDLLTIVEVNLKYYKSTEDENLNVLCEFLKIQSNKDLDKFREKYKDSEFGSMLWERYMKVILDKETMEEVEKMDMYQEKIQLRYHSIDEANVIMQRGEKKRAIETAIEGIKEGLSLDLISRLTKLNVSTIQKLQEKHGKG